MDTQDDDFIKTKCEQLVKKSKLLYDELYILYDELYILSEAVGCEKAKHHTNLLLENILQEVNSLRPSKHMRTERKETSDCIMFFCRKTERVRFLFVLKYMHN